ncbi:hypothetical protein [Nocardioides dongkuii]|uniref:hypothetical protein n=1 Tax=Nocardioides dongkuii TaxID=2760089 RepID=UPI0015F79BA0|nr:hypothetical protein [Nocardioides dongkuii]
MSHQPAGPPVPRPAAPLDLLRAGVGLGVALLATAVVLSTLYARFDDELDWSNYLVGIAATLGLLGVAAAAFLLARDQDASTDLVTWPGAFGAAGVGLMVAVALDDSGATVYLAGLATLALCAAGLWLTRRGPFVVVGVLALFAVYLQLMDDVLDLGDGDDIGGIKIALALTFFAVAVTAAGWLLPATRVLSALVAGGITVAGFAVLTGVLAISSALTAVFGSLSAGFDEGPVEVPATDGFSDDGWTILVLAFLLVLGWTALAALTRHVGFRLLVVAMAVTVTPIATRVLLVDHPTWWGVVLGAVGGAVLVAVGLRAKKSADSARMSGFSTGQPVQNPDTGADSAGGGAGYPTA